MLQPDNPSPTTSAAAENPLLAAFCFLPEQTFTTYIIFPGGFVNHPEQKECTVPPSLVWGEQRRREFRGRNTQTSDGPRHRRVPEDLDRPTPAFHCPCDLLSNTPFNTRISRPADLAPQASIVSRSREVLTGANVYASSLGFALTDATVTHSLPSWWPPIVPDALGTTGTLWWRRSCRYRRSGGRS